MKAFPFSLDGAARDCACSLSSSFQHQELRPSEKIRLHPIETLNEYWERFNKLCATCPYHQINEQLLIQYFYTSFTMMERSMINATSGEALMDKTPVAIRHLISNMASNT
ncbi:hypothetical protein CR513_26506, partial [Mucuna pruriens]